MPSLGTLMMMAAGWRAANLSPGPVDVRTWENVSFPDFGSMGVGGIGFADGVVVLASYTTAAVTHSFDDGVTWSTPLDASSASAYRTYLSYGNGVWSRHTGSTANPKYSTDLINWTTCASLPLKTTGPNCSGFFNGMHLVAGSWGRVAVSANGATWTRKDAPSTTYDIHGVAYHDGEYWFAASTGRIFRTPNLTSWTTLQPLGATAANMGIACGNGCIVAIRSMNTVLHSADNGATWRNVQIPVSSLSSIVFGGGRFVACGSYPPITSVDGITWEYVPGFNSTFGSVQVLKWDGSRFWMASSAKSSVPAKLLRTVV